MRAHDRVRSEGQYLMHVDVKLEDTDKVVMLICSLRLLFNHLITTLMFQNEILDYKEVVSVLRSHQTMQKLET